MLSPALGKGLQIPVSGTGCPLILTNEALVDLLAVHVNVAVATGNGVAGKADHPLNIIGIGSCGAWIFAVSVKDNHAEMFNLGMAPNK